ncbi:MAG TPA: alpha/beta fold hydrolase [Vicinamibacteria bacterium]
MKTLALFAILAAPVQSPGTLDIEALLDIRHPSGAVWSPDGNRVAFVWDRAGTQNLYVVDAVSGWPEPLTEFASGLISEPFWSLDGSALYFEREGELWSVMARKGSAPKAVFGTVGPETEVRPSPDGTQVAFLRLGDVWVRGLEGGREKRLTVTLVAESGLVWSPDGQRIAFGFSRTTPREESHAHVGEKIAFRRIEQEPGEIGVVSVTGGEVTGVASSPEAEESPRWIDATRIVLERFSPDYRSREILAADVITGAVTTLNRERDEKWWSLSFLGAEPRPSPDGKWVAFLSDVSGWDSLYIVASYGGSAHKITADGEEASRFAWSPDSRRLAFDTNRSHPGQRHLAIADVSDPSKPGISALTEGRGTNTQIANAGGFVLVHERGGWSPDGNRILYQHTDPARPADLHWIEASGGSPRELTQSLPTAVDRSRLVEPQLVRYASVDGREVPAYLFVPKDLDRSRKHPAIIWIHGDGIAQNYDGWHTRRDYAVYYSFHQYLAQRGYVVIAPDYRGSVGYGRSFRLGPYRDLGGLDYQDVAAAVPYLESLLYVDPERVGVWGLSYGGFLTLQALTSHPERYRCGIDVAGVQDFRDWFRDPGGNWIGGRLGDPAQNPDAYQRAAPIERVDRITRPLLVLHGTADVNVPFLESLKLVDRLTKEGKDFDFVVYPGEFHYFHREHVLRDFFRRVATFFDRNLREVEQ